MALVAAGVANGGDIMEPHVVDRVLDSSDGELISDPSPQVWRSALRADIADTTAELMVGVVESGTGSALQRTGLRVGAKTGTAEVDTTDGSQDTHAWMIAFAGPEGAESEVALAVIIEAVPGQGQQTGGGVAGPVAAAVIDAYFG